MDLLLFQRKAVGSISLLLLFLICVRSECEVYGGSSLSTSSLCSPFVSSQIYVASKTTQSEVDALLSQSEAYQSLLKMVSIIPMNCYKSYASFLCQGYFPTCNNNNNSSPIYPCYSSCSRVLETCESIWNILQVKPINCTSSIGDSNCESNIFPTNAFGKYSNPTVSVCPSVYAMRDNPTDNEAICSIRCPDPGYTLSEFQTIAKVNITLAVISMVLIIYVIGGYIMEFAKRKFPARLQIWLLVSILGFQVGTLMSGSDPEHTTMCVDSTTYSTQSNNATCAAQGFFLIFFSLAAALWLLVQSGVTFFAIVLEKRPKMMAEYEKYYHVFVWAVTSIFIIIIFATRSVDFSYSTRIYCFISVDTYRGISIDYPLYYIPMTIILGFVFIFFSGALIKLLLYGFQNKKFTASQTHIRAQRRILIVTALMIILFAAIFVFRYNNTNDDMVRRNINKSKWINCKVRADIFGYDYPHECDTEVNPSRTSFGPKMFQNVGLAMLGAWVFLGFGTDSATLNQWITLAKCIYRRDMSTFWRRLSISRSKAELISSANKTRLSQFSKEKKSNEPSTSTEFSDLKTSQSSDQVSDLKLSQSSEMKTSSELNSNV